MGFGSVKNLVASVADATPAQFDDWRKAWRAAADSGSAEPLLAFIARERGVAEDVFLQKLAHDARLAVSGFAQAHDSAGGAEQNFHEDRVSIFRPAHGVNDGTLAGRRQRSV